MTDPSHPLAIAVQQTRPCPKSSALKPVMRTKVMQYKRFKLAHAPKIRGAIDRQEP